MDHFGIFQIFIRKDLILSQSLSQEKIQLKVTLVYDLVVICVVFNPMHLVHMKQVLSPTGECLKAINNLHINWLACV